MASGRKCCCRHGFVLLILVALVFRIGCVTCSTPLEGLSGVTSIKALTGIMYRDMKGSGGAYKLMNATGPVGSQGSDDSNIYIDAPLIHYTQLDATPHSAMVVLVPVKQSVAFFQRLQADPALQGRVEGVLVDDTDPPSSYSTLGPFPGAEYAPYPQRDYIWNAAAGNNAFPSALMWLPAPTFLLTPEMAADAQQRADYNAQGNPVQQQYHARLKLTMASSTSSTSSQCLPAGACKPLGGFSVWSALPPLAPTAAAQGAGTVGQPIILVVAQMDSIDMFHDSVQGADGPLSGLAAMLGALHVLKKANATSSYGKQLVFLALAGEPWGYMGSRRLLYEAAIGSNATAGLDLSRIEQVIEVGQVGRLGPSGMTLFAHAQQGTGFGNASSMISALTAAAAQEASQAGMTVQPASSSNPGIPPSSLMSFLRVNASIQGLLLTEFDKGYINPFFASRFDNGSYTNATGIAATAAVLAAGLHRLAGGNASQMQVNMTELQIVVNGYVSCFIMPVPGFACPLASRIMTADYVYSQADGSRSYAPKNYVGVLQYIPDVQGPVGKSNLARFLWNVMALESSTSQPGAACDPFTQPCPDGQVCAGWRASGSDAKYLGRCMAVTVRYVPSYSTSFTCQSCDDFWQATWQLSNEADAWNKQYNWPPDPAWTESDWPLGVPDLQLYLHESPAVENGVLIAGSLVTVAVGVVSYAARVAFARHQLAAVVT